MNKQEILNELQKRNNDLNNQKELTESPMRFLKLDVRSKEIAWVYNFIARYLDDKVIEENKVEQDKTPEQAKTKK